MISKTIIIQVMCGKWALNIHSKISSSCEVDTHLFLMILLMQAEPSYLYDYTLGAGLNYDLGGVNLKVDYAYRHLVRMTANNVISVKIGF